MPGEYRYVDRRALALEQVQVLRHRLEVPADSLAQHFERHAFHLGQVAHYELAVAAAAGRDGEAAIADHRGGHPELGRGRYARIPGDLGVVMRVAVYDPRHQRETAGVEGGFGPALDLAHGSDAVSPDRQIAARRRRPEPV